MLVLVIFLQIFLLCQTAGAFLCTTSMRRKISSRHSSIVLNAGPDTPAWVIDLDSSEVSSESSTELLRRREEEDRQQQAAIAAKIQQQQQEQQNILKFVTSLFKAAPQSSTSQSIVGTPTATPAPVSKAVAQSVPIASTPSPTQLSQNKSTAFDFGLLIAFPFIVGTLIVFLVFPILGPQLAKTLPPPMSY